MKTLSELTFDIHHEDCPGVMVEIQAIVLEEKGKITKVIESHLTGVMALAE